MIKFFLMSLLSAVSAIASAAPGGYLFVTFKGESTPLTEQVYFGLSPDGREWSALNGGRPVLVSGLGEKGVRDPFILRSHDGKTAYLIATDLSINLNNNWSRAVRAGSRAVIVWESTDLVNWSEPRRVEVAPPDAGCTWAPEAVYDEQNGDYLVFWASTTKRDDFKKHRIWAARTKDFRSFGEPFVFIEKATTIIDTTIIHDGTQYYRFTKDEQFKAITFESADKLAGPWRYVENFSLSKLQGYEGPACFPLAPTSPGEKPVWCLLLDHYSRGEGYKPFVTTDLAGGKFTPASDIRFPFRFRHGTVLAISDEEFARLKRTYGP
jgi:hypothetical protein